MSGKDADETLVGRPLVPFFMPDGSENTELKVSEKTAMGNVQLNTRQWNNEMGVFEEAEVVGYGNAYDDNSNDLLDQLYGQTNYQGQPQQQTRSGSTGRSQSGKKSKSKKKKKNKNNQSSSSSIASNNNYAGSQFLVSPEAHAIPLPNMLLGFDDDEYEDDIALTDYVIPAPHAPTLLFLRAGNNGVEVERRVVADVLASHESKQ